MKRQDALGVFARGAMAAFILQSLGLILAWGVQVALARLLPRASFGIYVLVSSLTVTLAVPATLGLPVAMVRFLPEYHARNDWPRYVGILRGSRNLILLASFGVAVLTALFLTVLPSAHSLETRAALLLGLALIPALALSSWLIQVLRGMGRVAQAVWPPALLQPAVMLAGLAALSPARIPLDSRSAVVLLLVSTLVAVGMHFYLVHRCLNDDADFQKAVPVYEMRRWLQVSFPLLLTAGFQIILAQMDVLTVAAVMPSQQIAIYGVAAKLSRFITLTAPAAYLALGPSLAAAYVRGDLPVVQRAVTAAAQWTFWPSCVATAALLAGGRYLLALYGPGFEAAYVPLCILGLGFLVNAAAGPGMVILNMTGHHNVVTKVSAVTTVGGIVLTVILTHYFGVWGAAIASATAMAVWNVWLAMLSQTLLSVQATAFCRASITYQEN